MFVNMETTVLQEYVNVQANEGWNLVVSRFLSAYDRSVAVGKIASAIQSYVYELDGPADPLAADLYAYALKRVDFFTIALELIQAAEAAEPCQVHESERPMAA
jgi:hypothetical protein